MDTKGYPAVPGRLESFLLQKISRRSGNRQPALQALASEVLCRISKVRSLDTLLESIEHLRDTDLLDEVFDRLSVSYYVSLGDRLRIPSEGRLIVVANHPLGALDGLALLRAVKEVRPDVRIVVNEWLMEIDPLKELFLPYGVFTRKVQRQRLSEIGRALENEEAVIFFPAAEVARMDWRGIRESRWRNGPVHFAMKCGSPILPVHMRARNSAIFYASSLFTRTLSTALLPREIFTRRTKTLMVRIGDVIPARSLTGSGLRPAEVTRLLKKHVGRLGKGRAGVFQTEKSIIPPVRRSSLLKEIACTERLGRTSEGYALVLTGLNETPTLLREVGRLRERAFRSVGEGTGERMDLDRFDSWYRHLVLYDEGNQEVVGAYRLGLLEDMPTSSGSMAFYGRTLFSYGSKLESLLPEAVELGRSFIQPAYWNSRALDSLWQGIGAFLVSRPHIRYMIGCVSISGTYPEAARGLIVDFYRRWFGDSEEMVKPRIPYVPPRTEEWDGKSEPGLTLAEEAKCLKRTLKQYGCSIPTLYKQYADLCEPGGVRFLGFGVDPDFGHCVDGFILVDTNRLKPSKRKRYLDCHGSGPEGAGGQETRAS